MSSGRHWCRNWGGGGIDFCEICFYNPGGKRLITLKQNIFVCDEQNFITNMYILCTLCQDIFQLDLNEIQ